MQVAGLDGAAPAVVWPYIAKLEGPQMMLGATKKDFYVGREAHQMRAVCKLRSPVSMYQLTATGLIKVLGVDVVDAGCHLLRHSSGVQAAHTRSG